MMGGAERHATGNHGGDGAGVVVVRLRERETESHVGRTSTSCYKLTARVGHKRVAQNT